MTPEDILKEVAGNFTAGQRRKFLPGLLIAFIRTLRTLGATGGKFKGLKAFYKAHPRRTKLRSGGSANTLVVWLDAGATGSNDESLSIRRAYDDIQDWFRSDQKRFDYPSSAPHATQAWADYEHWIDALLTFSEAQLEELEENAKKFVLEALPAQSVNAELVKREPPRFYLFLRDFDLTAHKGEPTGAAFQAAVFGYLRADAAHLQVDVGKVRAGSKRVGRVGDIDARDGELLVLAAEVKQYTVTVAEVASFSELADQVGQQKGLGLVAALDFEDGAREALTKLGLEAVSRKDLVDRVRLWDSRKQQNAVQALRYCVFYKEQNSALFKRITEFLESLDAEAVAVPVEKPKETG